MQLVKLLHETFKKELGDIHQIRLNNVLSATQALIKASTLTVTGLGRNLSNEAQPRSNIKKMDRLVGSVHLQEEAVKFYEVMNRYLIAENARPSVLIDWSCICSKTQLYVLRASIAMQGRSVVLYEECHPKAKENNHKAHKNFLNCLKALLPGSVKPIIITDAGFRAKWFGEVVKMGWDFVGRLRNKNSVLLEDSQDWQLSSCLYEQAKNKAKYLGKGVLTHTEKLDVYFVLYRGKKKNRQELIHNKARRCWGMNQRYAQAQKEPWLLVSSLCLSKHCPKKIVACYRQRMGIEENFRDTKSTRYGFGLNESRTRTTRRMQVLLLIAAIATFACWLAGIFTRQTGKAAAYQAQSSQYTSALSFVYLGKEALKKKLLIRKKQFRDVLQLLFKLSLNISLKAVCHE